ncbi:TonB family protein [bacterium]|nr:TonB family protein [bacterium]RQV94088.1 MAG: TonB family protein [bacterium]
MVEKYEIEKSRYRLRIEKGLIFSLLCMILLFLFSRRIPYQFPKQTMMNITIFTSDMIPITSQGGGSMKRPPLPQVPIPSDDVYLPDYETIEPTDLDVREGIPFVDGTGTGNGIFGGSGNGTGGGGAGPRPILEVIPEYPEEERKKGFTGIVELSIYINGEGYVDSVFVLNNTTRSRKLEQSAVEAAYRSRYAPLPDQYKSLSRWIDRAYRFDLK